MLTPEYLAVFSNRLLAMYDQLEVQIVVDIARRLVKNEGVTDSALWQYKQAMEIGGLQEEIDGLLPPDIEAQVEAEFGDQVVVVSQTRGITEDMIHAEARKEPRLEEAATHAGLVEYGSQVHHRHEVGIEGLDNTLAGTEPHVAREEGDLAHIAEDRCLFVTQANAERAVDVGHKIIVRRLGVQSIQRTDIPLVALISLPGETL